jgi:hypothetical protein
MITIKTNKLMMIAGACLLVAIGLLMPLDAIAATGIGTTIDAKAQAAKLGESLINVPRLIALASYVIGAFFAVRALFALKDFIEKGSDDAPITKVLGFGGVAVLLILLPYVLGVISASIGSQNVDVESSSASFKDQGTFF